MLTVILNSLMATIIKAETICESFLLSARLLRELLETNCLADIALRLSYMVNVPINSI